ncbi:MAG TPA: endonuclease NucS domain-containing protein [Gaiellales bacterium]|nr:endonuclease NucS domain-containing protein [Gaiellales bacterium]
MRILVARCEIAYQGRALTRLGEGERVILFKDDGSICVHAERGFKPVNYMPGPTAVTEQRDMIRVHRAASGESLVILLHEVLGDHRHPLTDAAVLELDGAERQLHLLLERAPETIEPGLAVLEREHFTDVGPVDLFCRDASGRTVVVEVKRVRAVAAHVEQLTRYCERVDLDPAHAPCRGILAAPEIAPQARVMCEARGYSFVEVDYERLRGDAEPDLTLF